MRPTLILGTVSSLAILFALSTWSELPPAELAPQPAVTPPFDEFEVVQQVQRSFRRSPSGHVSYSANIKAFVEDGWIHLLQRASDTVSTRAHFSIRTARMQRGGRSLLDDGNPAEYVDTDGRLNRQHAQTTEVVQAHKHGVIEQSWQFDESPQGDGDLTVDLAVSEEVAFRSAGRDGLLFADSRTGVQTLYGHGTWIDAHGRTTRVPVEWSGDRIRLRVASQTLERSTFPAVLDPPIHSMFSVESEVVGAAMGDHVAPAVAFGGSAPNDYHLVVWTDTRWDASGDVYAARVQADGDVFDRSGFHVASPGPTLPGVQAEPTVAFDGSNFLIAWVDRSGAVDRILGTRVSLDGEVLDPGGVELTHGETGGAGLSRPAIGAGPDRLLLYEKTALGSTSVRAVMLSTLQSQQDDVWGPITVATGKRPKTAFRGYDLIVYQSEEDVFGQFAGSAGLVGSPFRVTNAPNEQLDPSVAAGGWHFLVAWTDLRVHGDPQIYGNRVRLSNGEGEVSDANGFAISPQAGSQGRPSTISVDGDAFRVLYESVAAGDTEVRATPVTGAWGDPIAIGASLDVSAVSDEQTFPVASSSGSFYLALWVDGTSADDHLRASVLNLDDDVVEQDFLVSRHLNARSQPAIAAHPSGYLVVWQDDRSQTSWDVYAARLVYHELAFKWELHPDDINGLPIATSTTMDERTPEIVWGDERFLVVWSEDEINGNSAGNIAGAFVEESTGVATPAFTISNVVGNEVDPAVGFSPLLSKYLVTWLVDNASKAIWASRILANGAVQDPSGQSLVVYSPGNANDLTAPAVDADRDPAAYGQGEENRFLVVWGESGTANRIAGRRMNTSGALAAVLNIALDQFEPIGKVDIVWGLADRYFVVWDYGSSLMSVFGQRVAQNGSNQGARILVRAAQDGVSALSPSVTSDGYAFIVGYEWDDDVGIRRVRPSNGAFIGEEFWFGVHDLSPLSSPDLASNGAYMLLSIEALHTDVFEPGGHLERYDSSVWIGQAEWLGQDAWCGYRKVDGPGGGLCFGPENEVCRSGSCGGPNLADECAPGAWLCSAP